MSERLYVKRLYLAVPGKSYSVDFVDGVNLITGPMFTGKSSILQLIDYVFGAKTRPTYAEISKCTAVLLQIIVGSETLTIQRSLTEDNSTVILYHGTIEDVINGSCENEEVNARHTPGENSVSNEILKRLGLSNITVKSAPTRDASGGTTYSLRDLLFLLYIDQDRMGSKKTFFEDHTFRQIKWKAGFEIVHYLFDPVATSLSLTLKDAEAEESRLKQYIADTQRFLSTAKLPRQDLLENDLRQIEAEIIALENKATALGDSADEKLGVNRELIGRRESLEKQIFSTRARIGEARNTLTQLGRLRVQYDREKLQLEFLKESETVIGALPIVRCPACFQPIEPKVQGKDCYTCHKTLPRNPNEPSVDNRLKAVKRRIKDLESYMKELDNTLSSLEQHRYQLEDSFVSLSKQVQRIQDTLIQPESQALLELQTAINELEKRKSTLEWGLNMRHSANSQGATLIGIQSRLKQLRAELDIAKEMSKTPEDVISLLSNIFASTLSEMKFPVLQNCWIDMQSYLPYIRGQVYSALSSKGALSLAGTAWHLTLLQYAFAERSLFPMFLMIDSPLSHVGHDSADPEFQDQVIVEAFYKFLSKLHQEHSPEFQILLVDNRPPSSANELVSIEFTRAPHGRYGLIEDEKPSLRSDQPADVDTSKAT